MVLARVSRKVAHYRSRKGGGERGYRNLRRSGDNTILQEWYTEVGILLPGTPTNISILWPCVTTRRPTPEGISGLIMAWV